MERDNMYVDDTYVTHTDSTAQAVVALSNAEQCCDLTFSSHLVVEYNAVTTIDLLGSNPGARACRAGRRRSISAICGAQHVDK